MAGVRQIGKEGVALQGTKRPLSTVAMSSNELKGDAFVSEAEKKMTGGGFFGGLFGGSKKEKAREAAEIFDKAANAYKLDKKCTIPIPRC